MLASAISEIASLGAVLPFLGALAAPDGHTTRAVLQRLEPILGFLGLGPFAMLTLVFVVLSLIAGVLRLVLLRATTWLTFSAGADLSMNIYERTLYQPYAVHIARNSAEIVSGITTKTNAVMFDVLLPSLTIVNSTIVLVFIFTALVVIDPVVALGTSAFFAACYLGLARMTYAQLSADSKIIARAQTSTIKALQEGLGGIREVLVNGTQHIFCEQYSKADLAMRRAQGRNLFTSGCPRYVMEALGAVTIALLAFVLQKQGGLANALPTLGALTLGVQRLLPAFQQAYNSWSLIMGSKSSLEDSLLLLDQVRPVQGKQDTPLVLREAVTLEGVKFRYQTAGSWIVDIEQLRIPAGSRVGIIGPTGSGKSTLLDIVMGLLLPTEGKIYIDDTQLCQQNLGCWQRTVSHVSQSLYLADTTIAENIAFGVERKSIDIDLVHKAAKMAQIDQYVMSLSHGYDTLVGERGVRLSGGQRQRIGVARALYKQASVLVLDEATSALDTETERAVMQSITMLDRSITLLIIAHRLSTLRTCDFILNLEAGKIVRVLDDPNIIANLA
nr:ABC transporter ATP-binding protein [Paludibacterium sp. B53371]